MKSEMRIMTATTLALFLASVLFADHTAASGSRRKKDRSVSTVAIPSDPTGGKSPAKTSRPPASSVVPQRAAAQGMGREHRRPREQGNPTPKVELFMGYSFWRAVPDSTRNRIDKMHGGSTSLAFNFNRRVGLVLDFGGFKVNSLEFSSRGPGSTPSRLVDAKSNVFTAMIGPRFSFRNRDRLTPFLQVLGGAVHADELTLINCSAHIVACTPLRREWDLVMTAGGGADYKVNRRIALRLFQAEYLITRFNDATTLNLDHGWQNNVRLSTGIVFRFGGDNFVAPLPPNRAPVVSCSVDKGMVYAGSGDTSALRAVASDPNNSALTYSWTATSGTVEGTGPEARWNSSGSAPGTHTINVRVTNERGGTADCSTNIRVEPQPNRPPTLSCSADRNSVLIGQAIHITGTASDPDNDPLTYSWKSSGGLVSGTAVSTTFETAGLKAGHYSVTGHVDDGHGGVADCDVAIELQEPPPPPEMVELETRLALHSIYFPTAQPTATHPNGGLLPSQANILSTLADDFKKYLKFRPEAHLILGGHADQRGSQEYNKALTERRVERTKNYLVVHGVVADAIETRSFGDEDNLSAEEVKEQVAQNPELTAADRQQMLSNLPVLVLANNRRVDVSLSTTGQQSTHRYPFNAKDYLALISTKNPDKTGVRRSPVKRKPRR